MAIVARYLLDTSVWHRRRDSAVAERVVPLITSGLVATCSVLDAEALYSTRSPDEYEQVRRDRRDAYEFLPINQEEWDTALEVQRALAARSMTRSCGLADLLIAATAQRHQVTVLHYDEDYERIASITGQPVERVVPRGTLS